MSGGTDRNQARLNQHREVVQSYVDGIVQGVARFRSDRAFASQVANKYLEEPDAS